MIGMDALSKALPSELKGVHARTVQPAWMWLLVSIIACVGLHQSQAILSDPDTQWHIFIGQKIIETASLPKTDTLSYTFSGQPWFAKEWLSQVILGLAHSMAGWHGPVVLVTAVLASTYFLLLRHVGLTSSTPIALAIGWSSFFALQPTILARPHVLVFPIIVLWTIALIDGARRHVPPWRALPLMVLWANLHAGFAMGLAIAACIALDSLVSAQPGRRLSVMWQWLAFGIASSLAVMVTPYGAQSLILSLSMAQAHEAVPFMSEWQPLAFSGVGLVIPIAAGIAALALITEARVQIGRILLLAFLSYATFRHARFIMILALVAPVIAGHAISQMIWRFTAKVGIFQRPLAQVPDWIVRGTSAAVLLLGGWLIWQRPVEPPPRVFPSQAFASVPPELRTERVFNSYEYGGFLIAQGVKTFIDGRSDQLFLNGFISRVVQATRAPEPNELSALLDEYAVRWSLVSQTRPETALFRKLQGWRLHFEDDRAAVFVRR